MSPTFVNLPQHIAITMDGNGRWAAARGVARAAGHKAGLKPVRMCVEECTRLAVPALTLFAFSSENWGRPAEEVGSLMSLFVEALDRELDELHEKGVRLKDLQSAHAESQTTNAALFTEVARLQDLLDTIFKSKTWKLHEIVERMKGRA